MYGFLVFLFVFLSFFLKCLTDKLENSWKARGTWHASAYGQGLSRSDATPQSPETGTEQQKTAGSIRHRSLTLSLSIYRQAAQIACFYLWTRLYSRRRQPSEFSNFKFSLRLPPCSISVSLSICLPCVEMALSLLIYVYGMLWPTKSYCRKFMCSILGLAAAINRRRRRCSRLRCKIL